MEKKMGRPAKMSEVRLVLDPSLAISNPRLDVLTREVEDRVKELKEQGYTIVKGNRTRHVLPTSIREIQVTNK